MHLDFFDDSLIRNHVQSSSATKTWWSLEILQSFLTYDDCWFRKCSSTFSCWVGNKNDLSNISIFISGFCMFCSYKLWVLCNQYIIYLTLSLASWLIGQILWTGTTKCNITDFVILSIFVLKPLKLLISPSIIIVMLSFPAVLRFSLIELKEWSTTQLSLSAKLWNLPFTHWSPMATYQSAARFITKYLSPASTLSLVQLLHSSLICFISTILLIVFI